MEKLDLTELQKMLAEINKEIAPLEAELKTAKAIHEEGRRMANPELKAAIAKVSSYGKWMNALPSSPTTAHSTYLFAEWLGRRIRSTEIRFLYFDQQQVIDTLEVDLNLGIETRDLLKSKIEALQQ